LILYNRNTTGGGDAVGEFAGIAFDVGTDDFGSGNDAFSAAIIVERDNATTGLHDGNLSFATNDAAADGLTKRMTITHDGLVGIGEEDPDSTLEVNGDIHIIDDLFVDDFARIDALRVGVTNSDPGDGRLHVEDYGVFEGGLRVGSATDPGANNLSVAGDITVVDDLFVGDCAHIDALHVGTNTDTDPGDGRLLVDDYGVFVGGLRVGSSSDPGANNLSVAGDVTIGDDLVVGDCAHIDALHVGTNTDTDPGDGNVLIDGDVTLAGSLPKLILDSPSTGDNWTSQGAQISLGESGDGSAALHLTYTGDGYGRIGMGSITSGVPAYSVIKFYYAASRVEIPDANVEIHNALSVGHTGTPAAPLDVRTNPGEDFVGIFRNTSTADSGDSYILNLWHSQEDDTSDFDTSEHWILFSDNSGTTLGQIIDEVTYSTFTGAHTSQIISGSALDNENEIKNWKPGMILKSTGNINVTGSSMGLAWPETTVTTTQKDKAVMGVFNDIMPGSGSNWVGVWNNKNAVSSSTGDWGRGHNMHGLDPIKPAVNYNSVGEGMMLVTDTNGNIETGDYICSSNRVGHGEKQDDDLLHNYTVAKATQPIDFSTISVDSDLGYKSVLVACTYHCG